MGYKNQRFPKLGRFSGKKKAFLRILMSNSEHKIKSSGLKTWLVLHSTIFPFNFTYILQVYSCQLLQSALKFASTFSVESFESVSCIGK